MRDDAVCLPSGPGSWGKDIVEYCNRVGPRPLLIVIVIGAVALKVVSCVRRILGIRHASPLLYLRLDFMETCD